MDAGVNTDEEWLGGERARPAHRTVFVEIAGVAVAYLGGKEFRLKVHDLFFVPRPLAASHPLARGLWCVHRLVRQVV